MFLYGVIITFFKKSVYFLSKLIVRAYMGCLLADFYEHEPWLLNMHNNPRDFLAISENIRGSCALLKKPVR